MMKSNDRLLCAFGKLSIFNVRDSCLFPTTPINGSITLLDTDDAIHAVGSNSALSIGSRGRVWCCTLFDLSIYAHRRQSEAQRE